MRSSMSIWRLELKSGRDLPLARFGMNILGELKC